LRNFTRFDMNFIFRQSSARIASSTIRGCSGAYVFPAS
jgi:hypothetical protein